jgi:hypothetical protein
MAPKIRLEGDPIPAPTSEPHFFRSQLERAYGWYPHCVSARGLTFQWDTDIEPPQEHCLLIAEQTIERERKTLAETALR